MNQHVLTTFELLISEHSAAILDTDPNISDDDNKFADNFVQTFISVNEFLDELSDTTIYDENHYPTIDKTGEILKDLYVTICRFIEQDASSESIAEQGCDLLSKLMYEHKFQVAALKAITDCQSIYGDTLESVYLWKVCGLDDHIAIVDAALKQDFSFIEELKLPDSTKLVKNCIESTKYKFSNDPQHLINEKFIL